MESEELAAGRNDKGTAGKRSQLFTVRLWKHEAAGGSGYLGSVRDVLSGAFLNFRDWPELAAYMIAQFEESDSPRLADTEGGR